MTVTASDFGFDPADPAFIADPYPVLAAMRASARAIQYPERDMWLLPHFADVHAALRHRALGRIYQHRFSDEEFGQPASGGAYPRWAESERWSLLNLEAPDHTRLRRLISSVFTARSVAALRAEVERISATHLAGALADQQFDLISGYAQPFSIAVICTLLGVPLDAAPQLLDWSHAIVKMYELQNTATERDIAEAAADEFIEYVRGLMEQRRRTPADDLISALVHLALTDDEIVGTVIVLLNAGHEATVNTLGNGMRAALLHPTEWHRLSTGQVPSATAVEEFIRWDAPLQMFERWVLDDGVELAGRHFRRGERIGMLFGSANRDSARFPDADSFDIGRGDTGHIGFGGGTHFCIGAPLARLELDVSLQKLVARAPGLQLVGEPSYQPYFVIRGLRELVVSP